jgi:hypothetical protein
MTRRLLYSLKDADACALGQSLPRESNHQRTQLLAGELDTRSKVSVRSDEVSLLQPTGTQPKSKAIMHKNLQSVRPSVQKQVCVMRMSGAEDVHHARQRCIHAGSHVQRFHGNPGGVDPDHRVSSRSSAAHSDAADIGHCTITVPKLLRSSIRMTGSAGADAKGIGTKRLPVSTGALRGLTRTELACSASTTQRRNKLAFKP